MQEELSLWREHGGILVLTEGATWTPLGWMLQPLSVMLAGEGAGL